MVSRLAQECPLALQGPGSSEVSLGLAWVSLRYWPKSEHSSCFLLLPKCVSCHCGSPPGILGATQTAFRCSSRPLLNHRDGLPAPSPAPALFRELRSCGRTQMSIISPCCLGQDWDQPQLLEQMPLAENHCSSLVSAGIKLLQFPLACALWDLPESSSVCGGSWRHLWRTAQPFIQLPAVPTRPHTEPEGHRLLTQTTAAVSQGCR